MSDTNAKAVCLENDRTFCSIVEILQVLTNAEKQGQSLYSPLEQIEDILHYLDDEKLLTIYQRLLHGFKIETTHEQVWADDYFTFILLLCNLLNDTKMKFNQAILNDNNICSLASQ